MLKNSKSLHVFFINSSLQLASSAILSKEKKSIFFFFEERFYEQAKNASIENIHLINYDKISPLRKKISVRKYINFTLSLIKKQNPLKVLFYFPSITSTRYNYLIHQSKKKLKNIDIKFNIISDGTSNLIKHPLTERKQNRIKARENSIIDRFLGIRFTPFTEDRYGILSHYIDKIYVIPNVEHEYPEHKVSEIDFPKSIKTKKDKKTALVIGQNIIGDIIPKKFEEKIKKGLNVFFTENNIKSIYYLPHPSDLTKFDSYNFITPDYIIIRKKIPLELLLLEESYDYIISFTSTALLTSKSICDSETEILFIGRQFFDYDAYPYLKATIDQFKKFGIKEIEISNI